MTQEEKIKKLLEYVEDIYKNYDCREDAHRYDTPCYVCDAEKLYNEIIKEQEPYLVEYKTLTIYKYNKKYGDERICKCVHKYISHFDSYEDQINICEYCECHKFEEKC